MVQFIQLGPKRGKSAVGGLLEGLGAGITKGLEKADEEKQSNALLELLPGLSPEQKLKLKPLGLKGVQLAIQALGPQMKAQSELQALQQYQQGQNQQPLQQMPQQQMNGDQPTGTIEDLDPNLLSALYNKSAETPDEIQSATQRQAFAQPMQQQQQTQMPQQSNLQYPVTKLADLGKAAEFEQKQRLESTKNQVKIQQENYKSNVPVFKEATATLKDAPKNNYRVNRLKELSPKINPAWYNRILWKNNQLVFPAATNSYTQEFVKLLTDWITGAKESFGARVTNFELGTYLQRLPSILQSEAGRKRVLNDLELFNGLDQAYAKEVKSTASNNGLRNLDTADFTEIVEKGFEPKSQALIDKLNYSNLLESVMYSAQKNPKGKTDLLAPDGTWRRVDNKQVSQAIEAGYKIK